MNESGIDIPACKSHRIQDLKRLTPEVFTFVVSVDANRINPITFLFVSIEKQ